MLTSSYYFISSIFKHGSLVAFDSGSRTQKWKIDRHDDCPYFYQPVIGSEGNIIQCFGSTNTSELLLLESDGTVNFNMTINGTISVPPLTGEDNIYVVTERGEIIAFKNEESTDDSTEDDEKGDTSDEVEDIDNKTDDPTDENKDNNTEGK